MSENNEVTGTTEETAEAVVDETTETVEEDAAEVEALEGAENEFEFVEDPAFDIDYKGDCAYEVKVSVPAANTATQMTKLLDELQEQAELPGFSKGRAPRKLVENKFGKAARGDATEKVVGATVRKLFESEELKPLAFPDIDGLEDALDQPEDQPLEFTLKFEVTPRCTLGEYKGIAVERPVVKVEEADVQRTIDGVRERYATFETVENAEAAEGDQVVIDFKGSINGEVFAGGSAENYPYVLGSGRFFEEFEEALKGTKAGDELTCQVPFPEDYSNAELAGKTADFAITVHEIKRKVLPAFDDDFAKQAGFDCAEDFRERIETELREGSLAQSNAIAENNAIAKIVETSTFELPKSLVDSSAEEYYQQEVRRLSTLLNVSPSELKEREEDIRKDARENAIREIKSYVVVNEVAAAENIEITEEDFEQEASNILQRTGMGMEVVQQYLAQAEQRDRYESRIYRRKALAAIMDNAKVTDKEVSRDELYKEDDDKEDDE